MRSTWSAGHLARVRVRARARVRVRARVRARARRRPGARRRVRARCEARARQGTWLRGEVRARARQGTWLWGEVRARARQGTSRAAASNSQRSRDSESLASTCTAGVVGPICVGVGMGTRPVKLGACAWVHGRVRRVHARGVQRVGR